MVDTDTRPRILLLEDDGDIRDLLTGLFMLYGCDTQLASGSDEVREILDNEEIDLGLLDIMLPGADGRNIAREIRARGFEFPMYFMTGVKDAVDEECHKLVSGILCKPFTVEELQALLEKELGLECAGVKHKDEKESMELLTASAIEYEALRRRISRLRNLSMVISQLDLDEKIVSAFDELNAGFDQSLARLEEIMYRGREVVDQRKSLKVKERDSSIIRKNG